MRNDWYQSKYKEYKQDSKDGNCIIHSDIESRYIHQNITDIIIRIFLWGVICVKIIKSNMPIFMHNRNANISL